MTITKAGMRVRMTKISPLILFALSTTLICSKAEAVDCTFYSYRIPVPPLIYKVTSTNNKFPQVISPSWLYSNPAQGYLCNNDGAFSGGYRSILNSLITDTGKTLMLEGRTYAIYDTGVKGVGIIMQAAEGNGGLVPFTSSEITVASGEVRFPFSGGGIQGIRIVLTERPPSGVINIPSLTVMRYGFHVRYSSSSTPGNAPGYFGWSQVNMSATTLNVTYPGCTLNVPASVTLPKVNANYLRAVGQYSSGTPFNLTLTCFAGVKASYTMTDITNAQNRSTQLGMLAGPSQAKGIALQIVDGEVPVALGPDSSTPGAVNQRNFGQLPSAGKITKTFSVRYIRTQGPLAPGRIKSGATVTLSYL